MICWKTQITIDGVIDDLRKLSVKNLRTVAKNGELWRKVLKEAEARTEVWC